MVGRTFRDKRGRLVEVETQSRVDDLKELRLRTVSNLSFAYARAKLGSNESDYAYEAAWLVWEVDNGTRGWELVNIDVDGSPEPFELLVLGLGYWVAVGHVSGTFIALLSHGVPLGEIALASLPQF